MAVIDVTNESYSGVTPPTPLIGVSIGGATPDELDIAKKAFEAVRTQDLGARDFTSGGKQIFGFSLGDAAEAFIQQLTRHRIGQYGSVERQQLQDARNQHQRSIGPKP